MTGKYFKKPELDIESPTAPITVGAEIKLFFHPLGFWKMHLPKQGKYFTVNKSTTLAPFCHSHLIPVTFNSFLLEFQQCKLRQFKINVTQCNSIAKKEIFH